MSSRLIPFFALGTALTALSISTLGQVFPSGTASYSPDDAYWSSELGDPGIDGHANVLFTAENGDTYARGSFATAGVTRANNVACWDGLVPGMRSAPERSTASTAECVHSRRTRMETALWSGLTLAGGVAVNHIAK